MIAAGDVRIGDYIRDFGKVSNIRYFASPVASNGKSSPDDPYYKIVSQEINGSYQYEIDRVIVETLDKTRCFFTNEMLDVIVLPKALTQAA